MTAIQFYFKMRRNGATPKNALVSTLIRYCSSEDDFLYRMSAMRTVCGKFYN